MHYWVWISSSNFLRTSWNQTTICTKYKFQLLSVLMKVDTLQNAPILTLWTWTVECPNSLWILLQLQVFDKQRNLQSASSFVAFLHTVINAVADSWLASGAVLVSAGTASYMRLGNQDTSSTHLNGKLIKKMVQ
jgi:hypothetical protein